MNHPPRISIIAAIGKNRELGKRGDLIWRIPADLNRVKELTTGHPIIMGRKTYESIGRPLPNRTNIVVSSELTSIDGCVVCSSFSQALTKALKIENKEIFIFGGASIYKKALPQTDRLYLTQIDAADYEADTFFPDYKNFSSVVEIQKFYDDPTYTFIILEKP